MVDRNVYGGVVYGRILDEIVPQWWEEAPVQRWVTRRSTMIMALDRALNVDFHTRPGASVAQRNDPTYRADFVSWLAGKAVQTGAQLVTAAAGLLSGRTGRITGPGTSPPRTHRRLPHDPALGSLPDSRKSA